jgi:arsenate reductase-like glutaredoxin family protein
LQKKVQIQERDFFKNPLNPAEIENLLQGKPASEMFNFRSPSFKKLALDRDQLTDRHLMDLMLAEPRLIKRPVIRMGDNVYFGATSTVLADLLA